MKIRNPTSNYYAEPEVLAVLGPPQAQPDATPTDQQRLAELLTSPADERGAFLMKPASQWLDTQSPYLTEAPLFGPFWSRGEVCILFADTNVGKSILAVQIADAISKGRPIDGFEGTTRAETVLYFDFELTAPQFTSRYNSAEHGHYDFSPHFARLVGNPLAEGDDEFDSYADYLIDAILQVQQRTRGRILIIDNITALHNTVQSNGTAINLMKRLQHIKRLYGLSILVLAHTPKRNPAKPITHNCLQGSKMLINFADAAFAIGQSQTQNGVGYLKQIKQRSHQQQYGAGRVCLCRLVKPYNFLHWEFCGHEPEAYHLLHFTEAQRKSTEDYVAQLYYGGLSLRQIATQTGNSLSTVHRLVKRLDEYD